MVAVRQTGLIYIKEDLIIPSNKTFYDFIVTKARGKSGPLFDFGVNDDVRLLGGANVETEESHAGKVILRYVLLHRHSCTVCDCTIATRGGGGGGRRTSADLLQMIQRLFCLSFCLPQTDRRHD